MKLTWADEQLAPVRLWPHQKSAVNAILARRDERGREHHVGIPTGGGKTRVGLAVAFEIVRSGGNVLWLAKNWQLLRQALDELGDIQLVLLPHCCRIGGCPSDLYLSNDSHGRIFFTTLQTFGRRALQDLPQRVRPSSDLLVVRDEAHWSQDAPIASKIRDAYLGQAFVIGLTATPRESRSGTVDVAYSVPFMELVRARRLASPHVRPIETGVRCKPARAFTGEPAPPSLNELGRSARRNTIVLNELARGFESGEYRRIVMFACDIEHAERLAKACNGRGIPARALHSKQPKAVQATAIDAFHSAQIPVLVNVSQLVEGFDAPDIDAVFLCRPTTSRLLLTQMIGRGARRLSDKERFAVVDFTDARSDRIFHAVDLLPPAVLRVSGNTRQAVVRHHHEPRGEPQFANLGIPGLESVPYVLGQTFGVEIELTRPIQRPRMNRRWERIAQEIIAALRSVVRTVYRCPLGYHGNQDIGDPTLWYVTFDRTAGWEIVSPILAGREGFLELERATRAINGLLQNNQWALRVDHRTGLHITMGTRLNTARRLRGFLKRVQRLEPGLFSILAPSRSFGFDGETYDLTNRNHFCQPLRMRGNIELLSLRHFLGANGERYNSVNLSRPLGADGVRLVEVRMHHGTTNFEKIALWICLWMQIVNRSRYASNGESVTQPFFDVDRILTPSEAQQEDLFDLLRKEKICLGPQFIELLRQRRLDLREYWEMALPSRVGSWTAAGWYDGLPNKAVS